MSYSQTKGGTATAVPLAQTNSDPTTGLVTGISHPNLSFFWVSTKDGTNPDNDLVWVIYGPLRPPITFKLYEPTWSTTVIPGVATLRGHEIGLLNSAISPPAIVHNFYGITWTAIVTQPALPPGRLIFFRKTRPYRITTSVFYGGASVISYQGFWVLDTANPYPAEVPDPFNAPGGGWRREPRPITLAIGRKSISLRNMTQYIWPTNTSRISSAAG